MNIELPEGFTWRVPIPDDAQVITDLICQCDIADYGEPDFSVADLHSDWRRDGFELERDSWLVSAPDGTLVAYACVWDTRDHVRLDPTTCVHPKYRGRGIEASLIARAEEYTRTIAEAKTVQWIVNADHRAVTDRFEQRGYHTTRHDLVMEINMAEPPPPPALPAGIVLRSFVRAQDERAVWACTQEAFRDARGHKDLEFEAWRQGFMEHADWSAELSCVAQDGDRIAGAAMVLNSSNGGWIRQLGVRRPWRKKGLGLAILLRIFGNFYARGVRRIGLGVDADSLTGATRLYERAGMRVKNHFVRYEKDIV